MAAMRYKAFITYSHRADQVLASCLQHALQTYGKPYYMRRIIDVFRDGTDLSAHPSLWPNIQRALHASEFLLLLASPEAATSRWVKRELDEWFASRPAPAESLIILWTGGELKWDHDRSDFDWGVTTALPRILDWDSRRDTPRQLSGVFRDQPYHADLRWARHADNLALRNPEFSEHVASIAAALHGMEKRDMVGLEVFEHGRFRRVRRVVIAALVLLSLTATIFAAFATIRRREAQAARLQAEANATRNQLLLYDANVSLAAAAFEERAWPRGYRLLEQYIPARPTDDLREFYWRYLWRTFHSEYAPLSGTSAARSIAFAKDTGDLLTGNDDGTVTRWNPRTGQHLHTFGGGLEAIDSLSVSADGQTIVTGSLDGVLATWQGASDEPLRQVNVAEIQVLEDLINVAAVSPNLRLAATSIAAMDPPDPTRSIELWDLRRGTLVRTLLGAHDSNIFGLEFSSDGRWLVSGSSDGLIKVWEVASGRRMTTCRLDGVPIRSVALSHDRGTIAAGTDVGHVVVWDRATSKLRWYEVGHRDYVRAIAISADDRLLATGSDDGVVILWELTTGQVVNRLYGHTEPITSVAFSPDGAMVAASAGGDVRLWPARSPDFVEFSRGDVLSYPSFSNDRHTLIAFANDRRTLTVWDMTPPRVRWRVDTGKGNPNTRFGVITSSYDGRFLAGFVGNFGDAELRFWDALSGRAVDMCGDLARSGATRQLAFSRDSRLLAVAHADGTIRLCDMTTGKVSAFTTGQSRIASLSFLAKSDEIAVLGPGILAIYDLQRRVEVRRVVHDNFSAELGEVSWAADGKRAAASERRNGTVHLWDLATLREVGVLRGHDERVWRFAFSDDGRTLATWGSDDVIKLWDLRTNRELGTLQHPHLSDLQFTLSDRTLSVIDARGNLTLYRGSTNEDVSRELMRRQQRQRKYEK
jgi:WD40 repeat protein